MGRQKVCPKCELPLRRWTVGTLVAEGCLQCGGVFLSPQTYRALWQDPSAAQLLEEAFADQSPIPLLAVEMPCPQCGTAMQTTYLPEAPNVGIERCPQCGYLWFDDGELGKVAQLAQRRPSTDALSNQPAEEPLSLPDIIHCAHCGRENFSDALECWACGEPLVPEAPSLPSFWHRLAEGLSMVVGGIGALLFGLFVSRPRSEAWAAIGMMLMLGGLGALALLRRTWHRPRRSGVFPGFSE